MDLVPHTRVLNRWNPIHELCFYASVCCSYLAGPHLL